MGAIQVNLKAADGFGELATGGKYCSQNVLVDVEQDTIAEDGLITRTLTKVSNGRVKSVGASALSRSAIRTVEMPYAQSIEDYAFLECDELLSVTFPSAKSVSYGSFNACKKLYKADFAILSSIGNMAFTSCSALTALVLRRSPPLCTLSSVAALGTTPILNGQGYIYVPKDFVESYKKATNWNVFSNQFRAIEDYPDIVTNNLLHEGTFEGDTVGAAPVGWEIISDCAVTDEDAHTGSKSLKMSKSKDDTASRYATTRMIPVNYGEKICVEFMAKGTGNFSAYYRTGWQGITSNGYTGVNSGQAVQYKATDKWTKHREIFNASDVQTGSCHVWLVLGMPGGEYGEVLFDDVKIYRVLDHPAARIGDMDYATLDEALAAVREGDTVTVCAGKHIQQCITSGTYKNVTIEGEPGAVVSGIVFQVDLENVTVRNLTFTGDLMGISVYYQNSVNGLVVERCTFRNRNRAVHLHNLEKSTATYRNINISECVFDLRGAMAPNKDNVDTWPYSAVWVPSVNNLSVTDCEFRRVLYNGINSGINTTGNVVITGNTFVQVGSLNVNIPGAKTPDTVNLLMEGNTFVIPENPKDDGNYVKLGSGMDVAVIGENSPNVSGEYYYAIEEEEA